MKVVILCGGKGTRLREETECRPKPMVPIGVRPILCGGYFIANRRVIDYLDDDPGPVFEKDPLSAPARDGKLGCYEHDGFWQPMGTYHEFMLLNQSWDQGCAEWKVW
jgi:NDP-sugar pyrophosphorylase family protein